MRGFKGSGEAEFNYPQHNYYNFSEVYATDEKNHRVRQFGPDDSFKVGSRVLGNSRLTTAEGIDVNSFGKFMLLMSKRICVNTVRILDLSLLNCYIFNKSTNNLIANSMV